MIRARKGAGGGGGACCWWGWILRLRSGGRRGEASHTVSMFWASADYAPSAHFYPALSRDPSPRVYSCRASVTNCFKPKHEIFSRKEGKALLTQQLNALRLPTTNHSSGVSWGALTSSKLQAPSYEEAGKQARAKSRERSKARANPRPTGSPPSRGSG